MIEQETASVMRFVTDAAAAEHVYYRNMPENFAVPSVFFPSPETESGSDTLNTYCAEYAMAVMFFHKSTEEAYELALPVLHRISAQRRLIPELDRQGRKTGQLIRVSGLNLRKADECAYQLMICWKSRCQFETVQSQTARNFYIKRR